MNKNLVCGKKLKKQITDDIRNSVMDYVEAEKTTDMTDVYKRFGEPSEIAKAHLADADPKEIKKL